MVEQYFGDRQSIATLMAHGFSQIGYESIMSMAEWKANPDTEHTRSTFPRITELDGHDTPISLDDLKTLVKTMEDNSIDSAYIEYDADDDHCMQSIKLYIHQEVKVPMTEAQYMQSYNYYVDRVRYRNSDTYRRLVAADRLAADELATYQRLHAKYAGVK